MLNQDQLRRISGSDVYGSDGEKIGSAGTVYLDDQTQQPAWLTVNTGLFGMKENFVPISDADVTSDRVTVPYTKEKAKGAPNVSADGHLTPEEEQELYSYYGLSYGDGGSYQTGTEAAAVDVETDRSRGYADTDTAATGDRTEETTDDAMTVSEEQVNVGKRTQETGRARLRKYVVTEDVTTTVPVQKEKVVLDREPITDGNVDDAVGGAEISEAEHEVVLHEEVPVVEKTVTPVERVRLDTDVVTEEQSVSEQVRKERVDVEGDLDDDLSSGDRNRR